MELKSIYVEEEKPYTKSWLIDHLKYGDKQSDVDDAQNVMRKLKEYGVLKAVKKSEKIDLSELQDEDDEENDIDFREIKADSGDGKYKFNFVGVLVVNGRVLKCFPKYFQKCEDGEMGPKNEMCQIMQVLERYDKRREFALHMFNDVTDAPEKETGILDLYLFLLWDYFENGLYDNVVDAVEYNGRGEILWDKTVNEITPVFLKGRPCYFDVYTRRRIEDDHDYFKRLHRCVLAKVSDELKEADLLDLFSLTEVDFMDEEEDNFGDEDYILYRLDCELNRQFNSRKQLVLKALRAYFKSDKKLSDEDYISSFGTANFNLVWEQALRRIFDRVNLTESMKNKFKKPHWSEKTGNFISGKFIPDIMCIDDGNRFLILDAKYYVPDIGADKTTGMPGIESISKQYLYQMSLKEYFDEHKFSAVENCFLLPTDKDMVDGCEDKGDVCLDVLSGYCDNDIKVRFLPAKVVFDCYLDGREFPIGELKLDGEKAEERQMA